MRARSEPTHDSSAPVTIYHNPRCSKSRGALQILRDRGIEPTVIEYLQTPPDAKTLDRLLRLAGVEPRAAMRKQEKEYKELRLDNPTLPREQLIAAMVKHPVLIERPIVVRGDKAVIARPPERVEEIL
ncbi:MAG TPA: arsenate reductase (glutaredoxin) [Candidatus Binatia bacterium]|nr:arsenate reductase (glutaredoxin) [Candidatus Binatia bacterium]